MTKSRIANTVFNITQNDLEQECYGRLRHAQRIVVKLGTSIVTAPDGSFSTDRIAPIMRSLAELKHEGRQVVLVSSGAVGLGMGKLGLHRSRLRDLQVRQACAAVGQSLLMHTYEQLFSSLGVNIAQLLLTEEDFTNRHRYTNLCNTAQKLLKLGVLPIINENDVVSTAELEYGAEGVSRVFSDNDRLAALVMSKLEADVLVLLTNVDGLLTNKLLTGKAASESNSKVIPIVTEVIPEIKALASGPSTSGRGGMITKLEAAEIAMQAGGIAVIANGTKSDTLKQIFTGESIGTRFISHSRVRGKRRWIAHAAGVHGRLVVNAGAREAIVDKKASLLSAGVVRIGKHFNSHSVVSIADPSGEEFARGIINYSSRDIEALMTHSDNPIANYTKTPVLVARNNIVIL